MRLWNVRNCMSDDCRVIKRSATKCADGDRFMSSNELAIRKFAL